MMEEIMEERKIILKAENVIKQYKQYDTVVTAVNRANVEIYEGEMVAIIGSSGSGKSTFLHICAGLDRPNSGKIWIRMSTTRRRLRYLAHLPNTPHKGDPP